MLHYALRSTHAHHSALLRWTPNSHLTRKKACPYDLSSLEARTMASNDGSSYPPRGLGQPLVTVSNVHGSGIRPLVGGIASSPAGNDHPLAITSLPPPPVAPSTHVTQIANTIPAERPAPVPSFTPNPVQITNGPLSPQKKTLGDLADAFMAGPSYRRTELKLPPLLKPLPLPQNQTAMDRLRTLVERRSWDDVLRVSHDMLRTPSSQYAGIYSSLIKGTGTDGDELASTSNIHQDVVEIMTLECHAWLKLRRYADLGKEVEQWSFCVINDSKARHPDWVPWSLQILAAESLQYTESGSGRCIDSLYEIRGLIDHDKRYVLAVDSALSNAFLRKQKWRLSLESLDHMLEIMPLVLKGDLLLAHMAEAWSRQGRILLQVGAISEAEKMFAKTTPPSVTSQKHWIIDKGPSQFAIQQGMAHFARRNYEDAMASFNNASDFLRALPEPIYGYRKEAFVGPDIWVETPQGLLTQAWNNMGLSALYTCRMKEAVRLMESLVREDPTAYLTERLAFNLCTLYELGADTAASARKKRVLQLVATRFYLHDISQEQFRVN